MLYKIKKAHEIVQKMGVLYKEKNDSNWISYIDNDNCIHTYDYFADDSFCEDCIPNKVKEINEKINKRKSNVGISNDFYKVCYQTESSREGTNFHYCDECREIIHQSIIWTDQEVDHWTNVMTDNNYRKIKNISTYFELMKVLDPVYGTINEFPEDTIRIAERVIKNIK